MAEIDLIKISELPATSTIGDADELAVVQGVATKKVPYSVLKAGAEVTPDTTLSEAGVPADAAAVGAALALKANQAAVTQALATKADKTEVAGISDDIAELASVVERKADQTALNQKADKTTTDGLRQDLTTLNGIVNQKADKTELNTQIGNVTAELATKANTADVNNLLAAKANVASPVFTGRPQAPTAPKGTATLQLATTAFVQNAIDDKQDTLTFDSTPTEGSTNPVTSGGVWEAVQTDKTLAVEDKAADAKATGNVVAELKNDFSDIEGITLKLQSSTIATESYTAISGSKHIRLNASPIQSSIILGSLSLVANDDLINGTITVELTNFANGSYTVYASKTVSMSGATTRGELVRVCNVGITTIGETYVFIKTSLTNRFRAASGISGAVMVVGDDITSETFTTRNVAGYEVMYSLDYAATVAYLQTLTDKVNGLLVDVEIPDPVLFYNVGYYFNNSTAEMESAGAPSWVVSDYIPVGNGITVTGSAYSQYRPQIVEYDATYNIVGQQKLGAIGSITKTYTPADGVAFVRLQSTISTGNIASGTQKQYEPVPMVYHVEKDGSGDFTNLADAIAEATRRMDAVVYVGAGTWNIIDELGEDYLANMSATHQGIVLKNRVHVICSSKAYIKCLYSGSDANVINYLSAFNAGKNGFTLENADIEVANIRYCVHDERNAETDHYDNYYINCRMKNTNQTAGSRSQCIGGGLGYDGHIVIDGCTFENPLRENYGIVSYHNAHGTATDSRSLIEVKGSYFYGKNTFRAGYYGNTRAITQCLVHGNSMGAEPYMTQEDASFTNVNMEIIAWGNEIRNA